MKKHLIAIGIILFLLSLTSINVSAQYEYLPFAFGGICCTIYLISFVLWIVLAVWIYDDAKKRGESGGLWVLLVLFLGIIAIIIWLIIRPPIGGKKRKSITEPDRRCPNCGRVIPIDSNSCCYCGKKFKIY